VILRLTIVAAVQQILHNIQTVGRMDVVIRRLIKTQAAVVNGVMTIIFGQKEQIVVVIM
jgi:hypothetical protein